MNNTDTSHCNVKWRPFLRNIFGWFWSDELKQSRGVWRLGEASSSHLYLTNPRINFLCLLLTDVLDFFFKKVLLWFIMNLQEVTGTTTEALIKRKQSQSVLGLYLHWPFCLYIVFGYMLNSRQGSEMIRRFNSYLKGHRWSPEQESESILVTLLYSF